jgi:hypothetical protein
MKIALVGSAPSSVRLAPYQDPEWKIFGCSPGVYGVAPRVDAWFETHLWEPGQQWFSPEYCQWMSKLPERGVDLFVGGPIAELPGSVIYPFEEVLDEFDPHRWFCTSSLFWMMAMAMKRGATKIGFWGVDMAATEEYQMQRAGIHHLSYIAHARGIEVGAPHESDLFTPRFRYGADEWTHSFRKTRMRRLEMEQRKRDAEAQEQVSAGAKHFFNGALENLEYMGQTWSDKSTHLGPMKSPVITRTP